MFLSMSDVYARFRLRCQAERFQATTIEWYDSTLKPFIQWCDTQGITELETLTPQHIRGYMVEAQIVYRGTERERPAASHTVHNIARALRALFNFCVADELLPRSPMTGVKMPRKSKKILDALDIGDARRMIEAASNERDKALLYFLLDTGVRASECVSIQIGDIDLVDRSVRIRHGKGDKERMVYFGKQTAYQLEAYLQKRGEVSTGDPLWIGTYTHEALKRNGLFQVLRRIGRSAGVSRFNPHAFRRAFALNALRNGMNIYTLARLMGHSDIEVLRQYLAITEHDLRAAHQEHGAVDHML